MVRSPTERGARVPEASESLEQIKHIVVLMMENRSFDQMLGYLKKDGMPDVNGLEGNEFNLGPGGGRHRARPYKPEETVFPDKNLDPCHSKTCVAEQLKDGNGGFVKNFVKTRKSPISDDQHGIVMRHYTGQHLPTYDHLAREYCVCDAWHASVPGDTWPNRLYAMTGGEPESAMPSFLRKVFGEVPPLRALKNLPLYNGKAFTRHLQDAQWRWYSHDPGTLRAADGAYRKPTDLKHDNFTFFDRKRVSFATEAAESLLVARDSFLDDAAKGELRDVSWIDPNFIDLSVLDPNSNDDHPPSDVKAGQALVLEVYEALRRSPNWEDTLLVITYDEHGGFYDHVAPPPIDDGGPYRTLGVRVPAIVVGPRVKKFVCHEVFDHTTLIRTILNRFAPDPDKAARSMGKRVAGAKDLSTVLKDKPSAKTTAATSAREAVDNWRVDALKQRRAKPGGGASGAPDGAGQELELHDFQEEFVGFVVAMRKGAKLPSGQP
jgi:phospholipase C